MKRLLLVGGGHAHMTVMKDLRAFVDRGHSVTLISPDPYHYYSGMGPGMLGGFYRPRDIRFHVGKMVEDRGGAFVEGRAVSVNPGERLVKLADGRELPYDVVSFNIGSDVPTAGLSLEDRTDLFTVKPIRELVRAGERIREQARQKDRMRIIVAGGGPGGVEVAGNAWRAVANARARPEVTVIAGRRFLPNLPPAVARRVRASFARRAISIVEGQRLTACAGGKSTLADGREIPYDIAFLATGIRPPSLFADAGLPTGPDGGLLVNASLQSVRHPEIFGGGDCIFFEPHPLDKVGVYAVRENPVLARNLLAALEGGELGLLTATGPYLLIFNLGDGTGVLWKNRVVFNGRSAFWLKDRIDRKFMRAFQLSGERESA